MKQRRRLLAALIAGALVLHALPAAAQQHQYEHNAFNQFAAGFGSFVISPVYGAFKVALGLTGLFVGSATWAFTGGDTDTAYKVWNPTMRGTYVISPDHLRGDRPIRFLGN